MKYCVTLLMLVLCIFVSASAFSEGGVSRLGIIRISTQFTVPDGEQDYCRTCCHRKTGDFTVSIVTPPDPFQEWHLGGSGPTYHWTISPRPKGGVQGEDTNTLLLELADNDFPTSFDITVVVTWSLYHDDGGAATSSATATMQFDAIDYAFEIETEEGVDGRGKDELVDSHSGIVMAEVKGCRKPGKISIEPSAKPSASHWQNEVNSVKMDMNKLRSRLAWRIPSPYWYAKSAESPDCCYSNVAEYLFVFEIDGCSKHERSANVYLPLDDLLGESIPVNAIPAQVAEISREVINLGEKTMSKVKFDFSDYIVRYATRSGASSQYRKKINNEEVCHKNQCERKNGFEFEDAFSVSEVKRALKIGADDEYLVITDDDGVIAAARLLCERLIDEEFQNSVDYYAMNHDYREWKAKQRVGFREAYKYHCTYERFGASSPPIIKVPKVTLNN